MKRQSVLIFLAAMLLPFQMFANPQKSKKSVPKSPTRLVLTTKVNGLESDSVFPCTGMIHGYLTLPKKAVGKHKLEAVWIMPNGRVSEHPVIPIDFSAPGRQTAYIWYQFNQEGGGLLSSLREDEPVADNTTCYEGMWSVEVKWDDQPLIRSSFNMQCS